jgi:uncharacterized protein YaaW (UPF0174 family)
MWYGRPVFGLVSRLSFLAMTQKRNKKSLGQKMLSQLSSRTLEKLEKTSKRFFCFSTAPKFTPPPARLLPMATAYKKASFYMPSALWM